jgi:hypothetical protein
MHEVHNNYRECTHTRINGSYQPLVSIVQANRCCSTSAKARAVPAGDACCWENQKYLLKQQHMESRKITGGLQICQALVVAFARKDIRHSQVAVCYGACPVAGGRQLCPLTTTLAVKRESPAMRAPTARLSKGRCRVDVIPLCDRVNGTASASPPLLHIT